MAHRIDTPNKAADLFGAGKHGFRDGDKANGISATDMDAAYFNDLQENYLGVIEGAGIALVKGDYTQLRQAITKMIQGAQRAVVISNAAFAPAVTTSGQAVYWDSANTRFDLAIADGSAKQNCVGFADVADGSVYVFGDAVLFSGLTPGGRYFLSGAIAGAITTTQPQQNIILLGIAKNATEVFVDIDIQVSSRIRLTSNLTLYVATTGNDSNSGLSAGSPFLTIQKAWNTLRDSYDLNGFIATIQLADGTYISGINGAGTMVGQSSPNQVVVNGNAGAPASVLISTTSTAFLFSYNATATLQNLKIQTTSGQGVASTMSAHILLSNIVFGSVANAQIQSSYGGVVQVTGGLTVSSGAQYFIYSNGGETSINSGVTITFSGTPAFSVSTVQALEIGMITLGGVTMSGSATGARYLATTNSVINTNGGGASFIPGSLSGSVNTGGQYV